MRIDPRQLQEWHSRLENLEQLKLRQPQLAWLWDVRIKVLNYFCSRYGRQLPKDQPQIAARFMQPEEQPAPRRNSAGVEQMSGVRSSSSLWPSLMDLHEARCAAESDITARRGEDWLN
jgi:hypothetical protein